MVSTPGPALGFLSRTGRAHLDRGRDGAGPAVLTDGSMPARRTWQSAARHQGLGASSDALPCSAARTRHASGLAAAPSTVSVDPRCARRCRRRRRAAGDRRWHRRWLYLTVPSPERSTASAAFASRATRSGSRSPSWHAPRRSTGGRGSGGGPGAAPAGASWPAIMREAPSRGSRRGAPWRAPARRRV